MEEGLDVAWLQVEGYSDVGDVFAEEAVVLGTVFVAGIDAAGQTAFVYLVAAGSDDHHNVFGGEDAAGEGVAESDLAEVGQLSLLDRGTLANDAEVDVLLYFLRNIVSAVLL